jgi:hypothetical protein
MCLLRNIERAVGVTTPDGLDVPLAHAWWPATLPQLPDPLALSVVARHGLDDASSDPAVLATCVEIKILRRVCAESSRRPPRHRRGACSMAWQCRFLTARPSQDGRVIAEK